MKSSVTIAGLMEANGRGGYGDLCGVGVVSQRIRRVTKMD